VSEIFSAYCPNGHDVLGIEAGEPCPQCGDRRQNITITGGIAREVDGALGETIAEASGRGHLELSAGTGSGTGTWGFTGTAEGVALPVAREVQEILLRWTPLEGEDSWMLEVERDGQQAALGIATSSLSAIQNVLKDYLKPKRRS